jgi:hypothetical protein
VKTRIFWPQRKRSANDEHRSHPEEPWIILSRESDAMDRRRGDEKDDGKGDTAERGGVRRQRS